MPIYLLIPVILLSVVFVIGIAITIYVKVYDALDDTKRAMQAKLTAVPIGATGKLYLLPDYTEFPTNCNEPLPKRTRAFGWTTKATITTPNNVPDRFSREVSKAPLSIQLELLDGSAANAELLNYEVPLNFVYEEENVFLGSPRILRYVVRAVPKNLPIGSNERKLVLQLDSVTGYEWFRVSEVLQESKQPEPELSDMDRLRIAAEQLRVMN